MIKKRLKKFFVILMAASMLVQQTNILTVSASDESYESSTEMFAAADETVSTVSDFEESYIYEDSNYQDQVFSDTETSSVAEDYLENTEESGVTEEIITVPEETVIPEETSEESYIPAEDNETTETADAETEGASDSETDEQNTDQETSAPSEEESENQTTEASEDENVSDVKEATYYVDGLEYGKVTARNLKAAGLSDSELIVKHKKVSEIDLNEVYRFVTEGYDPTDLIALDITFVKDGAEVQPVAPVEITMTYHALEGQNFKILHFMKNGMAEQIFNGTALINRADFFADSFSVYAVISETEAEESAELAVNYSESLHVGDEKEITGNKPQSSGNSSGQQGGNNHTWKVEEGTDIVTLTNTKNQTVTVKGVKTGTAKITHEYGNGSKDTYTITVSAAPSYQVVKGDTIKIKTQVSGNSHSWSVADTSIATITGGSSSSEVTIKGVSVGSVVVTHQYGNNKEAFTVEVTPAIGDKFSVFKEIVGTVKESDLKAGSTLRYNITVFNDSDSDLNDITVSEGTLGQNVVIKDDPTETGLYTVSGNVATIASIAPGKSVTVRAEYTLTEQDITNSSKTIEKTATVTYQEGGSSAQKTATAKINLPDPEKDFDVSKVLSADNEKTIDWEAGETVKFDIYVRNDNTTTSIENITVKDNLEGAKIVEDTEGNYVVNEDGTATISEIAASDSVTVKAEYTVTQADQTAKKRIANTATATYGGKEKTTDKAYIVPKDLPTVNVYIYMLIGEFSKEAKEALGIEDLVTNRHGYAPVGILTVDSTFFSEANPAYPSNWATKQTAMLRSDADWTRLYDSVIGFTPTGMVDSDGYKYSKNNNSKVTLEMVSLARRDLNHTSGSKYTALFTQDGSTYTHEWGIPDSNPQLHLDCVFDTVTVNFYYDKVGGTHVINKAGTDLTGKSYIKGQHVAEPVLPDLPVGEFYEFYKEDGTKWNFAVDTVNSDPTNIIVKVSKKFAKLDVKKTVTNGKLVSGGYYAHEDGTPFKEGDVVEFDITVQNIGNYALKDVIVEEVLEGAKFVAGTGYTIGADGKAVIPSLTKGEAPAYRGGSVTLKAQYTVTAADEGIIKTNKAIAKTDDDITTPGDDTEDFIVGTPLKITALDKTKEYDGTALTGTEAGFKSEGLKTVDGVEDKLTVELEGTITNVNKDGVSNVVKSYVVTRGTKDVTGEYTVTTVDGTLKITPATLTVVTGGGLKEYDGTPLTNSEISVTGFKNNETASYKTTGSQTEVGNCQNIYTITWNGSASEGNYTVSENLGTLTVVDKNNVITKTLSNEPEDKVAFKVGETIKWEVKVVNIYDEAKTITLTE
ncbi:MAG: hypothetical protein HUJ76_08805, partial [Parasporobacterium sp.]|nr:hypothetical protein [Parasporobacterium sp.]